MKDVIVIKTSETHSDIHALIHGELPTLSPLSNVEIILTSEIGTKLLEDNFEQTPMSPLCCPLNPFPSTMSTLAAEKRNHKFSPARLWTLVPRLGS